MLEFSFGLSPALNSKQAATECVEMALGDGGGTCDLLVTNSTVGHNFAQAIAAARTAYDNPQNLRVPLIVSEDYQTFLWPVRCEVGTEVVLMQRV